MPELIQHTATILHVAAILAWNQRNLTAVYRYMKPAGYRTKVFPGIVALLLLAAAVLLVLTSYLNRFSPAETPASRRHGLRRIPSRASAEMEERSIGIGCVRLPLGTHGAYTVDVDWSYGHILFPDGTRIDFSAGLVERIVAPERRASFLWLRAERRRQGALYYGAKKQGNAMVLHATVYGDVFPANFTTVESGEESLQKLLGMARSYRDMGCVKRGQGYPS